MRRLLLVVAIGACGAPAAAPRAPAPVVAPPIALRDPAIPEPAPRKVPQAQGRVPQGPIVRGMKWIDGGELEDLPVTVPVGPFRRSLDVLSIAESDFWDRCVRDFVAMHAEPARRALSALIMRYATSCDANGRVVLERPLGGDGRARSSHSDVALVGTLSLRRVELALRLTLCDPLDVDRALIGTEGATWTSNRLEVDRDDAGCAVADIPLTRTLGLALRAVSEGDDAWVRFEGGKRVETTRISDEQKRDLALALDAYDAVAR